MEVHEVQRKTHILSLNGLVATITNCNWHVPIGAIKLALAKYLKDFTARQGVAPDAAVGMPPHRECMRLFLDSIELCPDWALADYMELPYPDEVHISWVTRPSPGNLLLLHTYTNGDLRLVLKRDVTDPTHTHKAFLMEHVEGDEDQQLPCLLHIEDTDIEVMMAWLKMAPREAYRQIQNLPCDSKWKSDAVFAYYATCIDKRVFHELPSQLQCNPIFVAIYERKVYSKQLQGAGLRALYNGTS